MTMKEFVCLFVIYVLSKTFGAMDKNKAGPFDIVIERVDGCPGKDEYRYWYKLKKINRTTLAIDADVQLTSPIENDMKLSLIVDQFANNAWKENYFQKEFQGSICKMAEMFAPELAHKLLKIAKVKSCPVPVGNYTTRNFPLVVEIKMIPVFFYNKYRGKLLLEKDGKRKICFYVFADIVPKRHKG